MNKLLLLPPLMALTAAAPAGAAVIDAKFSGAVASQAGTGLGIGSAIPGEFLYDTTAGGYLSFTVGSASVPTGFASTASLTPDLFSAIYRAQISPVSQGGTVNSTFTVDLEGLAPFPTADAVALLTSAQPAANLDTAGSPNSVFPSTFGYNTSNADGTSVMQVSANLASISVTSTGAPTGVPEPASLALVAAALLGVCMGRRAWKA